MPRLYVLFNSFLHTNAFRRRREKDKNGPLMTMLLQPVNDSLKFCLNEDLTVAINPSTKQLLHYEKSINKSNAINLPIVRLSACLDLTTITLTVF